MPIWQVSSPSRVDCRQRKPKWLMHDVSLRHNNLQRVEFVLLPAHHIVAVTSSKPHPSNVPQPHANGTEGASERRQRVIGVWLCPTEGVSGRIAEIRCGSRMSYWSEIDTIPSEGHSSEAGDRQTDREDIESMPQVVGRRAAAAERESESAVDMHCGWWCGWWCGLWCGVVWLAVVVVVVVDDKKRASQPCLSPRKYVSRWPHTTNKRRKEGTIHTNVRRSSNHNHTTQPPTRNCYYHIY